MNVEVRPTAGALRGAPHSTTLDKRPQDIALMSKLFDRKKKEARYWGRTRGRSVPMRAWSAQAAASR
ncbi:hypothetical protein, partial [Streptomyces laurentii]|uniref:hypothetical protein n=1 Tax=Streptomyces laurentii TaxID=39478 RepID=UPI0036BCD661